MSFRPLFFLLALTCSPLLAQESTGTPAQPDDLGLAYTLPSGWEAIDAQSSLPEVKERQLANAKTDEEKKEIACIQIPISARAGDPPSFLAVIALPFNCIGQILTDKDLPGFAEGSSEGPRAVFDFGDPDFGSYSLGSHHMWIERAKGNPKGHPEMPYTLEIACSLLKKSAACWMTVAGSKQSLREFEQNSVTLDGDFFPELVPANAFEKKPSQVR